MRRSSRRQAPRTPRFGGDARQVLRKGYSHDHDPPASPRDRCGPDVRPARRRSGARPGRRRVRGLRPAHRVRRARLRQRGHPHRPRAVRPRRRLRLRHRRHPRSDAAHPAGDDSRRCGRRHGVVGRQRPRVLARGAGRGASPRVEPRLRRRCAGLLRAALPGRGRRRARHRASGARPARRERPAAVRRAVPRSRAAGQGALLQLRDRLVLRRHQQREDGRVRARGPLHQLPARHRHRARDHDGDRLHARRTVARLLLGADRHHGAPGHAAPRGAGVRRRMLRAHERHGGSGHARVGDRRL